MRVRPDRTNSHQGQIPRTRWKEPVHQRVLQRYGQQTGIQDLTPHVARHTFAKNLVDQGVGLEKVARLPGYASLNTTRVYIVPIKRALELAVECLV